MKITAQDLLELGVIDDIIPEPLGGAHRDKAAIIERTAAAIERTLEEFDGQMAEQVRRQRHDRFLEIGRSL
jgi:acetyl-CoA carboxylase carboxyl transferase subunit alpha